MKIVFVSNYFNHHQKPFCEELYKRFGKDFAFVSTSVMREERKQLGYSQNDHPAYVCLAHKGREQRREALTMINAADVVIAGSAPNWMLLKRILKGKLLFRYSERPFKRKISFVRKFYHAVGFRLKDLFKKNIYLLCAGAYVAGDYNSIGMYKNRTYKWGYFPETRQYDTEALFREKETDTLLWCGRFIDWKHPDVAIRLAKRLKDAGYHFKLNMIGTGVMDAELRRMVDEYCLNDTVYFLGAMSPDQVRSHMEKAGIFLFTSDRQEGWGAVLNEAMNSGCAVVANREIGSVPFLLVHGRNGFVYSASDPDALFYSVERLLGHSERQQAIAEEAYRMILEKWNSCIAVDHLLKLIDTLDACQWDKPIEEGVCAKTT